MHWKSLRINVFDDSKRHTVIETQQPRQSESLSHQSLQTGQIPGRRSESAPRSPRLTDDEDKRLSAPEGSAIDDHDTPDPSTPAQHPPATPTLRRKGISFRRFRNASDPQLASTFGRANEDVPPVPPLPPTPMIITTSPSTQDSVDPVKRGNNKARARSRSRNRKDYFSNAHDVNPDHEVETRHATQASADSNLTASRNSAEEPGRLSTGSHTSSGGRERRPNDSQHNSETDPRFSDSSRSDQSFGDCGDRVEHAPQEEGFFSTKRFRLWPRINRSSFFPSPPKPRNEAPSKGKTTPPPAGQRSVPTDSAPKSVASDDWDQDRVSPLPSPSRSSTRPSSPAHNNLRRNPSTKSAPSIKSSSSRDGKSTSKSRQRSTTIGTTATDVHDTHQQTSPHLVSSARTSSSTSGRKSIGDFLSIPHRLRQNSEPPIPRAGSPGMGGAATPTSRPESIPVPPRQDNDTPFTYLSRLQSILPRGAIAGVLAQSGEEFFTTALRMYMRELSFFEDPIDMAIRKLLMEVILPKETQQIDRVLQQFSDRYHECNPGIFANSDQAYVISFSILILHTDVFNKNNKRKMQKHDYVKITRGESVSDDILECFYENICYTPFIHIDDANVSGRHLHRPKRPLFKTPSTENLYRSSKEPVDPYALILDNKLHTLKPSLGDVMNLDDTYTCIGPSGPVDMNDLHRSFAKSGVLQILSPRSRPDAFMTPTSIGNPADSQPGLVDIRVAKVGSLWRKELKRKRGRSPWQEWGAILTFSQLYFFRDVNWVKSLMSQHEAHQKSGRRGTVLFRPPLTDFKPDAIMSTYDAVALLDTGYKKHKHAFVFVRHNALEEVFLADNEADMEDWLSKMNYAAAFRTTGVRPKGMMMATSYEAQRDRISTADPIWPSNTLQPFQQEPAQQECPSPNLEGSFSFEVATASQHLMNQRVIEANEKLLGFQNQLDDLLRNARHLKMLMPIHPKTREQVIMAAGRMAARVKWVRQDIWRIKSYQGILLRDMNDELTRFATPEQIRNLPSLIPSHSSSEQNRVVVPAHAVKQQSESDVEHHPPSANVNPLQKAPTTSSGPASVDGVAASPSRASADLRRPGVPPMSRASSDLARTGRKMSRDSIRERAKSSSADPAATNRLEREVSAFSSRSAEACTISFRVPVECIERNASSIIL